MKVKQARPARLPSDADRSALSWRWLSPPGATDVDNDDVTVGGELPLSSAKSKLKSKQQQQRQQTPLLQLLKRSASSSPRLHWREPADSLGALSVVDVDEILPASSAAAELPAADLATAAEECRRRMSARLLFACDQVFLHLAILSSSSAAASCSSNGNSNGNVKLSAAATAGTEALYLLSEPTGKLHCYNCPALFYLVVEPSQLLSCLAELATAATAPATTSSSCQLSKPLRLTACLKASAVYSLASPADCPSRKAWSRKLAFVMQADWAIEDQSDAGAPTMERENLVQFFDQVLDANLTGAGGGPQQLESWFADRVRQGALVAIQRLGLRSRLRPYQRLAVMWAARQELGDCRVQLAARRLLDGAYFEIELPPPLAVASNTHPTKVYYSPYHNHFVAQHPLAGCSEEHWIEEEAAFRGGILADEMGLGKTVEMIALILAHPRLQSPCDQGPDSPAADSQSVQSNGDDAAAAADNLIGCRVYCPCNSDEHLSASSARTFAARYTVCCACGGVQHKRCVGLTASVDAASSSLSPQQPYCCPACRLAQPPLPARATLFVVPPILLEQVKSEFAKHSAPDQIRLLHYAGLEQGYVPPERLANCDVVVTTYAVLQRESRFVVASSSDAGAYGGATSARRNNRPARYPGHISPLTCVHWWRIVLDEAQMICSSNSQLSAMAGRLTAVHRWCVTGTPVQTGLADLYGLFLFLGAPVASSEYWFKQLLLQPYWAGRHEPLVAFTAGLLWRQTKASVADQLGIPPLSEQLYRLAFNGIEAHYYQVRMEEEAGAWRRAVGWLGLAGDTRLHEISRSVVLKQLMAPLSSMRQACDYPCASTGGRGGGGGGGHRLGGGPQLSGVALIGVGGGEHLTMEQVLDSLIQKTRMSLKEEHRKWLMAVNGLAAIAFNANNCPAAAAELYREALSSISYHREFVSTDSAQELHAIHWLQEVLKLDPELSLGRSLSEDGLADREAALRQRMVEHQRGVVHQAKSRAEAVAVQIVAEEARLAGRTNWLSDLLSWVGGSGHLAECLADLLTYEGSRLAGQLRASTSHRGAALAMHSELDRIKQSRERVAAALACLGADVWPEEQFREYVLHCLRRAEGVDSCRWCRCEGLFADYKKAVYLPAGFVEDKRLPPLIDSLLRRLQPMLARCQQQQPASADVAASLACLRSQLKSLELMRKEYNLLHDLWIELGRYQSVRDEIEQALTRLRLLERGEQVDAMTRNFVHSRLEFDAMEARYRAQKTASNAGRAHELGRLKYLCTLKADRAAAAKAKVDEEVEAAASAASAAGGRACGAADDCCPVCRQALGCRWHVLACAHLVCLPCLRRLAASRRVLCPVCRQISLLSDIKTATSAPAAAAAAAPAAAESDQLLSDFECYGDYSAKVAGVVRCLKRIESLEPGAKVLVFSCFPVMLELLRSALIVNGIPHAYVADSRRRDVSIERFKAESGLTVLLLSISYGANGLNLIEANHVVLVEPQLNPAQELQAIGRIDRIGQTRPTVVHRFLVAGTIEEALWSAVRSAATTATVANAASHMCNLTVGQLSNLLLPPPLHAASASPGGAEGGGGNEAV